MDDIFLESVLKRRIIFNGNMLVKSIMLITWLTEVAYKMAQISGRNCIIKKHNDIDDIVETSSGKTNIDNKYVFNGNKFSINKFVRYF